MFDLIQNMQIHKGCYKNVIKMKHNISVGDAVNKYTSPVS